MESAPDVVDADDIRDCVPGSAVTRSNPKLRRLKRVEPPVLGGSRRLWGLAFWLPDGAWDGGADEFEGTALYRGGGGELVEVVTGGQLDVVAGEGGEVGEQPAKGV